MSISERRKIIEDKYLRFAANPNYCSCCGGQPKDHPRLGNCPEFKMPYTARLAILIRELLDELEKK